MLKKFGKFLLSRLSIDELAEFIYNKFLLVYGKHFLDDLIKKLKEMTD